MQKRLKVAFTLLSIIIATTLSSNIVAQKSETNSIIYITTNLGYSYNSVMFLGKTPDTQSFFSYIGFGKEIKSPFEGIKTYVTRGIIPFIEYSYPKRDEGSRRDLVSGFGISPIGYTFIKPFKHFEIETGIKSGFNLISKTFPTNRGRRFNYSFDIKLAVQRQILPQTYLSLGYKFHHISNAQTGPENPGIDSNFIFFSIKQF